MSDQTLFNQADSSATTSKIKRTIEELEQRQSKQNPTYTAYNPNLIQIDKASKDAINKLFRTLQQEVMKHHKADNYVWINTFNTELNNKQTIQINMTEQTATIYHDNQLVTFQLNHITDYWLSIGHKV